MARKKVRILRTFGLEGQGFFAEGIELTMEVSERCKVPYVPPWRFEQLKRAGLVEEEREGEEHGLLGLTDKEGGE